MMKTKIECMVDKLIELTNDGDIGWEEERHGKYHYTASYTIQTSKGKISVSEPGVETGESTLALYIEHGFKKAIEFKPSNMEKLVKTIQEHLRLSDYWGAQELVDYVLEEMPNGD